VGDTKRTVYIVVLIAVIIGAVALGIKMSTKGGNPPQSVLGKSEERIDSETLEIFTKTYAEWQKLGHKDGKYKNPKTGAYTLHMVTICPHCKEKIPQMNLPLHPTPEESDKFYGYRCPRCGKYVYGTGQ